MLREPLNYSSSALQQLPNEEPTQVEPAVPPQVPSVEIFPPVTGAADAAGTFDDTVGAADDSTGAAEETAGTADETTSIVEDTASVFDDAAGAEETMTAGAEDTGDLQSPNLAWHPVPQCCGVEPQRPFLEQQFPQDEFLQVSVFQDCLPQILEVLTRNALTLRNRRAATANDIEERIV
ncbi:hypothetical protein HBI56_217550 [Parastagonospora nodorum]|nr:hypothetical protein HBH51_222160 [Parastagonospora nodorum]KAH4085823.1 hypothetical protein HBH46_207170 [Parastagonospora nodorum]KAH4401467.1 hypothetical protein HBH92_222860 [Parastagonospora nodorum]KAH4430903.1 hypothetical protein HBH91_233170 [Parastagonospora nodorum]KAH4438904.1 hypothetical protein HBH93_088100 [Parastagonospora nodorum]